MGRTPHKMKHSEEQDPVWDLLQHTPATRVAPDFARDVLREVGGMDQADAPVVWGWFSPRLAAGLAAAAAVVLACVIVFKPSGSSDTNTASNDGGGAGSAYQEQITIEEFTNELDELAYLSGLMDVPDTSLLSDEDLAALLF